MFEFWTSIPLMALAALVSLAVLVALSVADHRRPEPVPLRVRADRGPQPSATRGGATS